MPSGDSPAPSLTLWEGPNSKRPPRDPNGAEQVERGPRVVIEALHNFLGAVRSHHQERIRIAGQRTSEHHKTLPFKVVHERGVGGPILLRFERLPGMPSSAVRPNDREQA